MPSVFPGGELGRNNQKMLGLPGGIEWLVIGFIILLLMGKRIPKLMHSMGKAVHELKRGFQEDEESEEGSGKLNESKSGQSVSDSRRNKGN